MEAYKQQAADVEFLNATEEFERLRDHLGSADALSMDHAELEKDLDSKGREVLRLLFQDHISLRTRLEKTTAVKGTDGVLRTHLRPSGRPVMTIFGPIRLERIGAGSRGTTSLFPMDAELNLPVEEHSHGVQERIAFEAAKGSFDATVESIERTTGASVSKRQAEKLVGTASQDFDDFHKTRDRSEVEPNSGDLVILSFDGKGIVVRKQDLRPATHKASTRDSHKLNKRLSRGEKRNRKRMAMVSAVYSVAPYVREPQDIIGELRAVQDTKKKRPKPISKRVFASVSEESQTVIDKGFAEALRRDPEQCHRWAVLVDGQLSQLRQVQLAAKKAGVSVTIVLDVIHVTEYLWRASTCFHPEGSKNAETWVTERLGQILNGKSSSVAAGIRRSATLRNLSAAERKAADKCANYLLKNRKWLHYDEYLAAGLPIATGIIEGACRHLVKDRMDLTGARWSLAGADAVLRLRALRASSDFDDYWRYHLRREQERNHLSHYANAVLRPTQSIFPSPKLVNT